MSNLRLYIQIISFGVILGACSGGARNEPEMIASFPRQDSQMPQPPAQYVYNASLELDVYDVERAAGRAVDLAYQYRGYLVRSYSWQSGNVQRTSLVLAVPAANFDVTFNALSRLGEVVNQNINGQWTSGRSGDGWQVYSEITVQLNEQVSVWPRLNSGWNPLRTLRSAGNVFVTIFGFVVDMIIWLVVMASPFVVLGWVLHYVVKKQRHTQ